MSQLKSKNAAVLGISADTVESHKRFVEKEHLNFSLLADTDKKMMTDYGVLGSSGFANRVTFVIGEDGRVREIDRAVNSQFERAGTTLTSRHGSNLALLLSDWKARLNQPIPNFSVVDTSGKTAAVLQPGKKASVVLFLSARHGTAQSYLARVRELAADPAYKDVTFLALFPNSDETPAIIDKPADREKPGVTQARDTQNTLADHFGATIAPTAWVINAKGIAVYSGAIDNSPDPAHVTTNYLKEALDATLAGKAPATPETKPAGSAIKRVRSPRGR
jgi:peroxiredoxin